MQTQGRRQYGSKQHMATTQPSLDSIKSMSTHRLIQEPFWQCCTPPRVGLLVFFCGPLGVALAHCGIRNGIKESGCVGFSLTCFLCCIGCSLNRKAFLRHISLETSFWRDCMEYICCYCCLVTQEYRKMLKLTQKKEKKEEESNADQPLAQA